MRRTELYVPNVEISTIGGLKTRRSGYVLLAVMKWVCTVAQLCIVMHSYAQLCTVPDCCCVIGSFRCTCVNKKSEIVTDASTSYVKLKTIVAKHSPREILPEEIGKTLPWVHIVISNAKRLILNTYYSVNPEFLQGYLDEFFYKFNRRYFGERIFDRLLLASSSGRSSFKHRIY